MNDISVNTPLSGRAHDLSEAIATQQTAGAAQDQELARDFLARVQADIDEQVDRRVQQHLAAVSAPRRSVDIAPQLALALGSLVAAIPLTLIAGNIPSLHGWGITIVLGFIGWLNAVWSWAWSQKH